MNTRIATQDEMIALFRHDFPNSELPIVFSSQALEDCDGKIAVELDDEIVGIAAFRSTPISWDGDTLSEFQLCYVAKAHRKKGIGLDLCTFVIKQLIEHDRTPIHCDVTSYGIKATLLKLPLELQRHLVRESSLDDYGDMWPE